MKAREIADAAKEALRSGKFDYVRVNFANPDMVGHTGDLEATRTVRAGGRTLIACASVHRSPGQSRGRVALPPTLILVDTPQCSPSTRLTLGRRRDASSLSSWSSWNGETCISCTSCS